jgi:hypothetical protein
MINLEEAIYAMVNKSDVLYQGQVCKIFDVDREIPFFPILVELNGMTKRCSLEEIKLCNTSS